jgi:hypothetical protein
VYIQEPAESEKNSAPENEIAAPAIEPMRQNRESTKIR